MTAPASAQLRSALEIWLPKARALRRTVHARADLSGAEQPTTDLVLAQLPAGARVEPVAGSGAVVRIGGPGPAVAVRAELDALPIDEQTGVSWAAGAGRMHACGHDVHLAAALAVAHAVHDAGAPVPLVLVLQPREETYPSGARDVLASGALERNEVVAIVAAHVQPLLRPGVIASAPGAVNASADEFTVTMRGQGGHGAYPHLGADPVLAAAHFVVAAQQLVARDSDPMSAVVVSVGEIHSGTSPNVRPDRAVTRGTVRALNPAHRTVLIKRLEEVARGVAATVGCEVDVDVQLGEPALVNDEILASAARGHLEQFGFATSSELRSCGADDFAYYGDRIPALMTFVGTGEESGKLHGATFLPADDAVDHVAFALGAGYLAGAERRHG